MSTPVRIAASTSDLSAEGGASRPTASFTWHSGDLFVVFLINGSGDFLVGHPPPTFAGGTLVEVGTGWGMDSLHAGVRLFWGFADIDGSGAVESNGAANILAWQYGSSRGIGLVLEDETVASTITFTPRTNGSDLVYAHGDYNAQAAGRAGTPLGGNEIADALIAGVVTYWGSDWPLVTELSVAYGVTTGTGKRTKVAVEILPTTVVHDATSQSTATFHTTDASWTHTPVDTPRGVLVRIVQEGTTDQITGVTYGGVAMTRVFRQINATAELGTVYLYFLGRGIPTGAQTVAVTRNAANRWAAVCSTQTAEGDTICDVIIGADGGVVANPSLSPTLLAGGPVYYSLFSGLDAPTTAAALGTYEAGSDLGTDSAMWCYRTMTAATIMTIGWTAAADDVCHVAAAVRDAVSAAPIPRLRRADMRGLLPR